MYNLSPCWSYTCKHRSAQTLNKEPSTAVGLIMYNCTTSCRDLFHILCTSMRTLNETYLVIILGFKNLRGLVKMTCVPVLLVPRGPGHSKGTPPGLKTHLWPVQGKSLHGSLFLQKQQVPSNLYFWSPSYNKCIGGFCFTIFQTEKFLLCLCWILLAFLSICMFANVFCSKNDSWESWFDQKCLIFTKW